MATRYLCYPQFQVPGTGTLRTTGTNRVMENVFNCTIYLSNVHYYGIIIKIIIIIILVASSSSSSSSRNIFINTTILRITFHSDYAYL